MLAVDPFLTAYDPSDLPGASIDPLGFDRGYQYLAESILPGLTNVASRPRYWSVLCAALALADDNAPAAESPKQRLARRQTAVQRLERFWALACIRASAKSEGQLPPEGIRGLRYVQREITRQGDNAETTDADYKLLARQVQYGLVGIYSAVAERLRLVDEGFALHPELGAQLGRAFLEETKFPAELRKAVVDGREVRVRELAQWGERAHHSRAVTGTEGTALKRAFELHQVRRRMGQLLARHPRDAHSSELDRLQAIRSSVSNDDANRDLHDALLAVASYERCFRAATLGFQSLLWQVGQAGSVELDILIREPAIEKARQEIVDQLPHLDSALTGSDYLRPGVARWADALNFVKEAGQSPTPGAFVIGLLSRHRDVQHGKYDRGLRKTPWLEARGSAVYLTLSQAQRISRQPADLTQIAPHGYRTLTADRLLGAGVP